MMRHFIKYLIPAVTLIVGLVKMGITARSDGSLILPTCLGNSIEISIAGSHPVWMHCWGCYVALFGILMILGLGMLDYAHGKVQRIQALS